MQGITITRAVKLELTADQWSLYRDMPGRDDAAGALNLGVSAAINSAPSAPEAYRAAVVALSKQRKFGAADSEGIHMLEFIFEKVYGDQ